MLTSEVQQRTVKMKSATFARAVHVSESGKERRYTVIITNRDTGRPAGRVSGSCKRSTPHVAVMQSCYAASLLIVVVLAVGDLCHSRSNYCSTAPVKGYRHHILTVSSMCSSSPLMLASITVLLSPHKQCFKMCGSLD